MKASGVAALVALLAGVSAAMAGPAYAEPLSGTYAVDGGEALNPGVTWTFSACGSDCSRMQNNAGGAVGDLQRQGTAWAGNVGGCQTTINESSLTGTFQCPMLPPIPVTLTKVG